MNAATDKTYRRFLLGIATEEEETRAEEGILAGDVDASFLQNLEEELIDDYLLGNITREEKPGFTENFLALEERRERVAFAAALIDYARKQPGEQPSRDRKLAMGGMAAVLFWRRAALLATAAMILFAALAGLEQVRLRQQLQIASATQNELSRLRGASSNGNSGSSPAETPLADVNSPRQGTNLMPTIAFAASTRSVYPALLRVPAEAQFVGIDLLLSLPLAEKYRVAVLASNGEPLWAQEFPASSLPQGRHGAIVLPASILPPGLYHVHVERASAEGRIELSEDHVFRVARE